MAVRLPRPSAMCRSTKYDARLNCSTSPEIRTKRRGADPWADPRAAPPVRGRPPVAHPAPILLPVAIPAPEKQTVRVMNSKVRKAVFPAAGLGTRFLPATKAQPKEMLPLVDKPLIQYGVEEAL